jgi:hypothetical protein
MRRERTGLRDIFRLLLSGTRPFESDPNKILRWLDIAKELLSQNDLWLLWQEMGPQRT